MSIIHRHRHGESAARESGNQRALSKAPFSEWLARRGRSFAHAGRGLFLLLLTEFHFRVHLGAAVLVAGFGLFLQISLIEWLILILTITGVLVAEAFNSALERVVDLAHPDRHPLARDAKDLAAAAVLLISIAAAMIGLIIFIPRVYNLLTQHLL
jgi:undecaprenol kinase